MPSPEVAEPRLLHFLFVEDDDDHAKIVTRILEKERIGNTITRVNDGAKALDYLYARNSFEQAKRPDIVLLDLKLPKKDGHEVLSEIKADPNLMSIPVIVLTTSNAEVDRLKAYKLNANSYVVKPLDLMSFKKMIHDLNLYWGIWNAPA